MPDIDLNDLDSLTDDQLANLSPDAMEEMVSKGNFTDDASTQTSSESSTQEETDTSTTDEDGDSSTSGTEDDEESSSTDDDEGSVADSGDEPDDSDGEESDDTEGDSADGEAGDEEEVSFEDFYNQVTSEFKANGRNMSVDSPEDIKRLMSMGVDYSRKMQSIKPHMGAMRALEKAGILGNQDQLNVLIAAAGGDKDALSKLIEGSGLDVLEIGNKAPEDYKPKNVIDSEQEIRVQEVMAGLQDNPHYDKTMDILTEQFDAAAQNAVYQNPDIIPAMITQVESGLYDVVAAEVDKQRALGKLDGMNSLDAYLKVGDEMKAQGTLSNLEGNADSNPNNPLAKTRKNVKANPGSSGNPDSTARNQRRKKAAPKRAKSTKPKPTLADIPDLSQMTDEEFEKFELSKYE